MGEKNKTWTHNPFFVYTTTLPLISPDLAPAPALVACSILLTGQLPPPSYLSTLALDP